MVGQPTARGTEPMNRPAPSGAGAVATTPMASTSPAAPDPPAAAPAPPLDNSLAALATLEGVRVVEKPLPRAPEVLALVMHDLDSFEIVEAGPLLLVRRLDPDRGLARAGRVRRRGRRLRGAAR